jgi:hypothetical protein
VYFDNTKEKCFLFGVVYAKDRDGYENYSYGGDILLPSDINNHLLQ